MPDIDRALADISAIRTQLVRGQLVCGYGPAAIAATGVLAAAVAVAQAFWPPDGGPTTYFAVWITAALVAVVIVGAELVTRSRRFHSSLADSMITTAIEDFLPAGGAGALLLVVLVNVEPGALWMVPGLWQILVSLGLFAASRALPRPLAVVGAWYLVAGLVALMVASRTHTLTPALMGVPFAVGQVGFAIVLQRCLKASQ